ncbi:unnamed protein product [Prunus armeniaca]
MVSYINPKVINYPNMMLEDTQGQFLKGFNTVTSVTNYVHCDLKPDNILLVPTTTTSSGGTSFVAKIADFGLAKKTKVNYGRWRGTPRYLSPEAFINNKQDRSSDIWSLGCIVFEMLTGKSPWDLKPGYNPNNLPDMLMFDHLCTCKIPTGISDVARDFLKSCLAMKSRERLIAEILLSHSFVAQPQPSKEGHTKVKLVNSFFWAMHLVYSS